MPSAPTLLWFRKDLRLGDNSALEGAIDAGGPIVPVFIWAPEEAGNWPPGGASRWWLHHSLESLNASLGEMGGRLILRTGDSLSVLRKLIEETGANRIFWNRRYESPLRELDAEIKRSLHGDGVEVKSFNSLLLNEPHTTSTGSGQPYKVYTPYWKSVKDRPLPEMALPDLGRIKFPDVLPESLEIDALNLLPGIRWDTGFYEQWDVSEEAALRRLDDFLDTRVGDYAVDRDRPDMDGTSCLSPYLHWGQIGPRQIAHRLSERCDLGAKGPEVYLKEVYWREFAYNVLYHFPLTPDRPLREEYASFPWENDSATLSAWKEGRTGYPIVDAGMRQLWQTGWMHNRVRMIVSSLLVKHLLHNWHEGAKWFWDTLVDADLASNTLGWQWSGGCGADAAPYFRVFNPIIQGKKFDPDGDYVRKYVPELKNLDSEFIHTPWEAPMHELSNAGIMMGKDYPLPIIEHKAGRDRALAALDQFKG